MNLVRGNEVFDACYLNRMKNKKILNKQKILHFGRKIASKLNVGKINTIKNVIQHLISNSDARTI